MAIKETKNFKRNSKVDNYGDFEKLSPDLLFKAQELRELIDSPLIITSGFRADSLTQHGKGLALDLMAPEYTKQNGLLELYLKAEKVGFTGLGVYPYWKYQGQLRGGIHVDIRELQSGQLNARWMGVLINDHDPLDRRQQYIELSYYNLRKYKVIL